MNIYEAHTFPDPQLPFIFHANKCMSHTEDCPNWHENVELILFLDGEGYMRLEEKVVSVRAGSIAVINANSLHTFGSDTALEYHCLIVDRGFCIANHLDTNRMYFEELFEDDAVADLVCGICAEYKNDPQTPCRTQIIRAKVLNLMGLLVRNHSRHLAEEPSSSHIMDCVKSSIGYIRTHYQQDLSLDKTAEISGVSKYHFAREFHRITGYTFVSYVNLTRCEAAKQMLTETTLPIGTVSISCGFSNQSYFTRTFLRYVGMQPGTYRERHASKG